MSELCCLSSDTIVPPTGGFYLEAVRQLGFKTPNTIFLAAFFDLIVGSPSVITPYSASSRLLDLEKFAQKSRIGSFEAKLLDPGETPEQAVVREVLEETGLQVSILKSLGNRRVLSPTKNREVDLFYFVCELVKGSSPQFTVQQEEIAGCEWVPLAQTLNHLGPETFAPVREFIFGSS
jgi:NADH pyrophosphatase NudC (nudix superfamily)